MVTQRAEMDPLLLIAEWRRIKGASDHLILAAAEIIHHSLGQPTQLSLAASIEHC